MKKKLALLMAAMMTVTMVPVTAFASTKLTAVDEITTAVDEAFTSRVELVKDNDQVDINQGGQFDVYATLTNGKFARVDKDDDDSDYSMEAAGYLAKTTGIIAVDVISDTKAKITLDEDTFNQSNGNSSKEWKEDWLSDSTNTDQVKADWITANETDIEDEWKADYAADWKKDASNISQLAIDLTHVPDETEINTAADAAADAAYIAGTAKADAENAAYTSVIKAAEEEKAAAAAYKAANIESGLADACVLPIIAKAVDNGEVVVAFTSNVSAFKKASEVIATAVDGDADVAVEGVATFVEDSSTTIKKIKDITINGLSNDAVTKDITLKLKGNFTFSEKDNDGAAQLPVVSLLNDTFNGTANYNTDKDELTIHFATAPKAGQLAKITISNVYLKADKKADAGDVATITVSSDKNKDFSAVKLEVAKMVEEAVTYSVEDDTLPVIWAGKNYKGEEANTLKVSVEENNGDILNTSRKATFTFPEGIEVVDLETKKGLSATGFKYEIDENVVTIYNYQKGDAESKKTDFDVNFILNAAPTFSGDVNVTLGGQFDDVSLKVATVKAPYTVEAKTTDVLIDYRYVPVNNIVITEAEDGIFDDKDVITLAVEKMDFEDAGDIEVTEGNIEADVDIEEGNDKYDVLKITIKDSSTEASTMTISGLELYLDRTLPVGGYALKNIAPLDGGEVIHKNDGDTGSNILWENSSTDKDIYDEDATEGVAAKAMFKNKDITLNDSYVNVITAARDQDDSMTTKKIIITVGAATMTAGQDTVTLDAPAYINAENYTMLPLRAISEAFGATVNWDNSTRTVTILSGQRIISMTIGSKTMYINGTPVAMNTAPEISADRAFVPVRDLSNSLGISNVNWTEASGTVTLN